MKQVSNAIKPFVQTAPFHYSIYQRGVFSKCLFILLLAGFAIVGSSFKKENVLSGSENTLKKEVPFKGKFTLAFTATGVLLTGQGTHIGRFTLFAPDGGTTSTITAANGDQIFTSYTFSAHDDLGDNMVQAVIDNTITGGTGRFAGSAGSFDISVLINENVGTGDGTFDGMISY